MAADAGLAAVSGAVPAALREGERLARGYRLAIPPARAGGRLGEHLGRRAGSSLEFQEHRDYQPGDDLRHIDWNAFARSDRLTVKLYREEVTPHLDLMLDASRSMATEETKLRAAAGLTALFAGAAAVSGFTRTVWQAGQRCTRVPGGNGPVAGWHVGADDAGRGGLSFDETSPGHGLAATPPAWRPRGLRLLVSDLLWPEEPAAALQALLRFDAAAVIVVQVLSRAEVEPRLEGNLQLEDAETGEQRELFLDAEALSRYRRALAAHQERWRRACRDAGASFVSLTAEQMLGLEPSVGGRTGVWALQPLIAAEVLSPS